MWVLTVLLTVIQLFISNRSAYGFYTKSISNRLIPLSKYKLSNPYYSKPFTANSPKKYSKLVLTRRWLSATSDSNSTPKLDFNEDYYSVLEVIDTIDFKQLKKAYYKLVFKYHPDNKVTDEEKELANKQMMVINGAYRVLRNAETRAQYDKQRRLGMKGVRAGVKGTGGRYNGPTYEEAKQKVSESTTDTKSSSQKDDWTRYTRIDEAAEQYYQTNVNKARQTVNAEYTSPTVSRFWEKYGNGAAPPRKEPPRTEQAYQYSSDIYDEEGFPKFKTGRGDGSVRSLKV